MRLVATEYLTLDGVFEAPAWSGPYFKDECGSFKERELRASDALLLGRTTYEGFSSAWPSMTDETGFADRMNSMTKYVVSSTLTSLDWKGAQLVEGDLVEAVTELKARPGGDLLLSGSGRLVNGLLSAGLVDVLRLMIYPVVVGEGARLFPGGVDTSLVLSHIEILDSTVLITEYTPT